MSPTKKKIDAAVPELIGFKPTLAILGHEPAGKADAAALFRRRIVRLAAILGSIALVGVVLFLGPGFYHGFKASRATTLALQGEELIRENKTEEAVPTVRSAFLLAPDAPEVLRAMAQMLTAFNVPDAMTYWNWVLQTPGATDDDRRAAVECAMSNHLYSEASVIIKDLLARDGKNARNELLAARWSTQRGTSAETMHFATRAVNDDPTYKPAVLFLAVQELPNAYLHQDGINSLFQLADTDDAVGLLALHCLALDPNLKPAEIDHLIARLHTHPLAAEPERIVALTLDIRFHPNARETLIEQAVTAHEKGSPADLAAFAEWLNTNGEAARVVKLIPRDRALSDKNIFTAYVDALGLLSRWADLKAVLTGTTVPLEPPLVELYLSRCTGEMGDAQASDLHWRNAVAASSYDPVQSLHLAVYAEKLGQNARAAEVYRTLTQEPVTARVAYQGLLRVLSDADTRTRRDLLDEIVSHWPKDRQMETEDIGYNLLLNERVGEMHQRAVGILADDANSISHHTNVALACLRLNDPAGALQAYSHVSIDWDDKATPVFDLVVYAATLNANGHPRQAHRLLNSVNRHTLRPELRDLVKTIP